MTGTGRREKEALRRLNTGEERQTQIRLMLLKILHFGLTVILFYIFWLLFRYHTLAPGRRTGFRYNYYILAGYAVAVLFFGRTYNSYLFGYSRIRSLVFAQFLSQLFSVILIWLVTALGWNQWRNPAVFLIMLALQLFVDAVGSWLGNRCYYRLNPPKRTILIFRSELDKKRFGIIQGKPAEHLYRVDRELCYEGDDFQEIREYLEDYEAVFVAGIKSGCRNGIAKYCKERAIPGLFLPHIGDVIMQEAKHIQSFDSPVLFITRSSPNLLYALAKRSFDILGSLCGLILLSPLMLISAVGIYGYDRGPVIYRQVRLTQGGREFYIYKFRSMRADAEKDGVARLSTGDKDDRITPVGRIMRKTRIDEIPQLWNILKGDMSIVGPRPERPEIASQYRETIPDFDLRLQVKAGLTGYAQVYGKYNTDPYEKLEFDLLYINRMSIVTDLQLMFATFAILFLPESTEGVEDGADTAMGKQG